MKTVTFTCNKLVRDKVIEKMEQEEGVFARHRQLNDEELLDALRQKLVEESLEVSSAHDKQELVAELGDVFEVIDALKQAYGVTAEEIVAAQQLKREQRGGFEQRIFLEKIELADDHPRIHYFCNLPDKYKKS